MNNRQINQHIRAFSESRDQWIAILAQQPESISAAQHILAINSKIELLRTMWNWADESVEPYHH